MIMATTPVVTPKQQLRPLTEFNNAQILNMIRNEASPEYQRRMPGATQMNMDRQMATLMSSTQLKNEFYAALVNRIGGTYVNTWRWSNPLGVFTRASQTYGDTWQEIAVGMPLFFVGFKGTKERTSELDDIKPPSLKHNLSLLFKNKPLMLIVISGILGAARMVFTYTGGLYFCKYVLDSVNFIGMHGEGLYTLVTIAIVPGGLIASLLVPYLTKKIGKKQSYIWTNIAGGVALLIAFIVGMAIDKGNYTSTATLVIALLAIVVSGIPSGLTNIVSYAMIGDTIEYLELKTGERAEGICFAMQTFINKIGMAIGAFIGVIAAAIIMLVKFGKAKKFILMRLMPPVVIVLACVYLFLLLQLVFNVPMSWIIFLAMVMLIFVFDAVMAYATDFKFRWVELPIVIEVVCVMAYVIVGVTTSLWHPTWLLCLGGVVAAVAEAIAIVAARNGRKDKKEKVKLNDKYNKEDESYYTMWKD